MIMATGNVCFKVEVYLLSTDKYDGIFSNLTISETLRKINGNLQLKRRIKEEDLENMVLGETRHYWDSYDSGSYVSITMFNS